MLLQAQLLSDQGKIVLNKMGNPENRKNKTKTTTTKQPLIIRILSRSPQ